MRALLPGDYGLGRAQVLRMVNSLGAFQTPLAGLLSVVKVERSLGPLCSGCYLAEADEQTTTYHLLIRKI